MHADITKNIFLADDDPDDRLFFEDAVRELGIQTQLVMTADGVELMTVLDSTVPPPPHVVFLDLNMPRMGGMECLAEIRRIQKLKNIPVVIFSTSDSPKAIEATYNSGATYFICKPRTFDLFKRAIQTVLSFDSSLLAKQPPKEEYFLQFA